MALGDVDRLEVLKIDGRQKVAPVAVLIDENDGEAAVIPDLAAVPGRFHGVGQPLHGWAEKDVDPPPVGEMAGPSLAVEQLVGTADAALVFCLESIFGGARIGVPPLPELLDEPVLFGIGELQKDLALLAGHDVLDPGIEVGVLRAESVL